MLVLQLFAVHQASLGSLRDDEEVAIEGLNDTSAGVFRALTSSQVSSEETAEWLLNDPTNLIDNVNVTVMTPNEDNYEHQWYLSWIAIQSYLATVLQVSIAFLLTQARAVTILTNVFIGSAERKINGQLKSAIGDVFQRIFQRGFGAVKLKFLTLIRKMDKLEEPMRKVKSNLPSL